jgi:CRP/FNR family transcriptional regulator, dissimilatory nitrate respiration regulator
MNPQIERAIIDLRAASLFTHLDEDQLVKVASVAQPLSLPADRTLFLQGDTDVAFYLLAEGRVKVYKLLRDGRTATIRHVEAGQTFAEAALFHEAYPSSAETMTDSRLYRFETRRFLDLLLTQPQLSVNLVGAMAELLGLLNRRVEELLLPVAARLARFLLALADEQLEPPPRRVVGDGQLTAGGRRALGGVPASPRVIKLPTSKREVAARLGTVPETLSRTFDRFKRAKVIRMSGDHELIEILDFDALHRLAQH